MSCLKYIVSYYLLTVPACVDFRKLIVKYSYCHGSFQINMQFLRDLHKRLNCATFFSHFSLEGAYICITINDYSYSGR